jgi:transcriptional regulator with GAF, ATPase, and Fis domain
MSEVPVTDRDDPWTPTPPPAPTRCDRRNDHALRAVETRLLPGGADAADDAVDYHPAGALRASRLIVSRSAAVRQALSQAEQVARTTSTVLLLGETGAGKEVFAQAIHGLSARRTRRMVRVSCAAIPSALIESELFGRERGAYTGALSRQIGRFEAAIQSTIFLDEIGELSAEVQVKLLRVLQDRVIERLGSSQSIAVDVRIIAATNRNLEQAVADKAFREDLFYRLNVFPIVVPPLRERMDDIPELAWTFAREFAAAFGKPIESISDQSMRQLQQYPWPGNVRELRNVIERAVIIATGPRLTVPVPQLPAARRPAASMTLRDVETEHIRATLESTNWRVRGHGGAAERLGLKPTTLETRMAKLGITRPKPGAEAALA